MTCAMEDVMYDRRNFNQEQQTRRHPLYATDRHLIFHLEEDDNQFLVFRPGVNGNPLVSPRLLRDICINQIVTDSKSYKHQKKWLELPGNVYVPLMTEAILLRESQAISTLVSTWPNRVLRVHDVIPLEDTLDDDYLTVPFENDNKTALIDCFVLGLLKIKPECNLKYLDFSGFEKDKKLCRELCRLPILWMKPTERTVEKIHDTVSDTLDITKDKVQRFLNRISVVYSNVDIEYKHGNKIQSVTVFLDLRVALDDVPIGLCLQHLSPFRFSCSRLWLTPVKEVLLPPDFMLTKLDFKRITHFEYDDSNLPQNDDLFETVLTAIGSLVNLFAVSLPCSLDAASNQLMATKLNAVLRKLPYLQRLNFSYCNLKGQLSLLLGSLHQRFNYVNLKDCRLDEADLFFLSEWQPLHYLRDLDLSCNNLQHLDQVVIALLERMPAITCLSVSYCSLDTHSLVLVVQECKEASRLKVLGIQGYTPLPEHDILEVVHIACQIPSIQKLLIFPEAYAFPGDNDTERELNKLQTLSLCFRYMDMKDRPDIEIE